MTLAEIDAAAVALPRPEPLDVARTALFLDLDGTLAAIAPGPDEIGPDPRRARVLARLQTLLDGRLAVVSGRTLADLDRILEGAVTSLAGVHGLQRRRADGEVIESVPAEGLAAARRMLEATLPRAGGLIVEDKGLAIAVHYRQAPDDADAVLAAATEAARRHGLELQHGSMVIELRPPGADKGDAIAAFMAEAPFKGFTAVFVGDDLTDENGFRTVEALGGSAILVGPRRPTLASRSLAGVGEVMAWLEAAGPHSMSAAS
jgi:trehalose 6-phosphate phosphatase